MANLLHAAALARELNISRMSISKALHSGRIAPAEIGPKGQPLFDLETVKKVFVVAPLMMVRPPVLQGGRPCKPVKKTGLQGYKKASKGKPAPALGPAFTRPDGTSSDWFGRYDLETCFPGIGREMAAGHLKPVGKFPGGGLAYSFEAAAALVGATFE